MTGSETTLFQLIKPIYLNYYPFFIIRIYPYSKLSTIFYLFLWKFKCKLIDQ
jgi:hypothetical protein